MPVFSLTITCVLAGDSLPLAAEKKCRLEVAAVFSRDRDDIGRMFNCGSKRKRIFSSWRVLVAFHECDGVVTTDHHAFRQEQQRQPSYGASAIACSMDSDKKGKAQDGATSSM